MISGDSVEYDKLAKWTDQLDVVSTDFILTAEIGVREGYGSHVICENIKGPHVHVGIDPYGDIDYKHVPYQINEMTLRDAWQGPISIIYLIIDRMEGAARGCC